MQSEYFDEKITEYINAKMSILECWMNYIDPKKDSVDIGANFGYIAYYMSKYSKIVHCIEPNPILIKELDILSKNLDNLKIYPYALSNNIGTDILSMPYDNVLKRNNYGIGTLDKTWLDRMKARSTPNRFGDIFSTKVNVCTLDSLKLDNIGAIKVDVEGLELKVLEGSYTTIMKHRPTLLVEIWYEPENSIKLLNEIKAIEYIYNYEGFFYDAKSKTLKPALGTTTEEANFLFLPN